MRATEADVLLRKGRASFPVKGTLPYLTDWVVSFFVLNLELGLHCEVHVLVSRERTRLFGCLSFSLLQSNTQ